MQDGTHVMSVKSQEVRRSPFIEIGIEMKQRAKAMQSELREADAQRRSATATTHASSGRTVGFVKRSRQPNAMPCKTEHGQIHR